jgi:hypothetical protein
MTAVGQFNAIIFTLGAAIKRDDLSAGVQFKLGGEA